MIYPCEGCAILDWEKEFRHQMAQQAQILSAAEEFREWQNVPNVLRWMRAVAWGKDHGKGGVE